MKRSINWFVLTWLVIAAICLFLALRAEAADIGLCRTADEWGRFELLGFDLLPEGWGYVADGAGPDGTGKFVLDALDDGTVLIMIPDGSEVGYAIIEGNENTPLCGEAGWQPGALSIVIPLTADCSFVEIQDPNGNWHLVTSNGEPILLHYGEALIGGDQTTDPAAYRAVPTACY